MPSLVIDNVTKDYGAFRAIKGVSFAVEPGEFIVMVGPSGCGKSTLLRIIAGLEPITAGRDHHQRPRRHRPRAGRPRRRDGVPELRPLSAHERRPEHGLRPEDVRPSEAPRSMPRCGAPPKSSASPSISASGRRSFPAGRSSASPSAAPSRARPRSSSSTSRSRTSTPRSDRRCASSFRRLHSELKATMVYVTHDQTEAMTMADRIVVINARRRSSRSARRSSSTIGRAISSSPASSARRA